MWPRVIFGVLAVSLAACTEQNSDPNVGTAESTTSSTTTITSTSLAVTTFSDPTTSTAPSPLQVLVFHKTAGFRHDSIPAGIAAITELGEEHGYTVTATNDASAFTESGLTDYDAIVFLSTTGDILNGEQQHALESFIRAGKGFVGIHSATDTEYEWPWYEGLVGAYFGNHPAPQTATVHVLESEHPTMQGLPPSFVRFDEWYNFRSLPGPEVVILATVDESSYEGGTMGELHPSVWAQEYDGGRSWYTAFGHTVESFSEPLVLTHLVNGILWAARSD